MILLIPHPACHSKALVQTQICCAEFVFSSLLPAPSCWGSYKRACSLYFPHILPPLKLAPAEGIEFHKDKIAKYCLKYCLSTASRTQATCSFRFSCPKSSTPPAFILEGSMSRHLSFFFVLNILTSQCEYSESCTAKQSQDSPHI